MRSAWYYASTHSVVVTLGRHAPTGPMGLSIIGLVGAGTPAAMIMTRL